jgi:hypothetical protein
MEKPKDYSKEYSRIRLSRKDLRDINKKIKNNNNLNYQQLIYPKVNAEKD